MSRYVDEIEFANALVKKRVYSSKTKGEALDEAPSIDIVRCKECKHCSKDHIKWSVKDEDGNWIDTKCNLCRRTKLEVNLDDFCSYGERKTEPSNSEKPNNREGE